MSNYTPYSRLTDDELIREVCNKEDPTDLELELMERMTYWREYADTMSEGAASYKVQTKYKEAV